MKAIQSLGVVARLAASLSVTVLLASCGGGESPEGQWYGQLAPDRQLAGVVLGDDSYYVLYSRPGEETLAGVLIGKGAIGQGMTSTSSATDFNWEVPVARAAEVKLELNPRKMAVQGTVRLDGTPPRKLSARHDAEAAYADSIAPIVGRHTGTVVFALGPRPGTTFNVYANGAVTTELNGCKIVGQVSRRQDEAAYDLVMRLGAYPCFAPGAPFFGVAWYREDQKKLYAAVALPAALGKQAIGFVGTKQ
ncbi:MAG TPA: hypothetical protein VF522_18900 [Ramlibacter sp.]|uniref:hypothetical protein n=1 Tax=Ramlibacter sp. TaxID=1917967 RepID=UPI002ED41FB0